MTVMSGQPVVATLLAASPRVDVELLGKCRAAAPASGAGAVTMLPGVLIGRYLGASSEAAKNYFIQLWRVLRPAVIGRAAIEPRIWRT
jgi:urease accessory protein